MSEKRKYRQSPAGREAKQRSIRSTKPWLSTRGPTTEEGKRRSSQNALKHGERSAATIEARKKTSRVVKLVRDLLARTEEQG